MVKLLPLLDIEWTVTMWIVKIYVRNTKFTLQIGKYMNNMEFLFMLQLNLWAYSKRTYICNYIVPTRSKEKETNANATILSAYDKTFCMENPKTAFVSPWIEKLPNRLPNIDINYQYVVLILTNLLSLTTSHKHWKVNVDYLPFSLLPSPLSFSVLSIFVVSRPPNNWLLWQIKLFHASI